MDKMEPSASHLPDGSILWGIPAGAKIDKNVAVRAKAYQLSLFGKRDEQRSCGGRWKTLSPRGHGMPCPYSLLFVILSKAKNLSIRVIGYFTSLRSVQYDTHARARHAVSLQHHNSSHRSAHTFAYRPHIMNKK